MARIERVGGATRVFEAMTAAQPRYPRASTLGRGTYQLLGGRLALAQGRQQDALAAAAEALALYRTSNAPWWMAKAIRLAQRAGNDNSTLEREVSEIERRLGAVGPTV
jgi:hypothetical protein